MGGELEGNDVTSQERLMKWKRSRSLERHNSPISAQRRGGGQVFEKYSEGCLAVGHLQIRQLTHDNIHKVAHHLEFRI